MLLSHIPKAPAAGLSLLAGALVIAACAPSAPTAAPSDSPEAAPPGAPEAVTSVLPGLRPPRAAQPSDGGLATFAAETFWTAFEAGDYGALGQVRYLLTAAFLENPADPQTALLLAHAHLWEVSERDRLDAPDPTITDHLVLADSYFEEAARLAPDDARILGWLGSARFPLGDLRGDSALVAEGQALLAEAVRRYPAFNHFTAGFVLSGRDRDDPLFAEGLDQLWRNVDVCSGAREAEADAYDAALDADVACANSEKAPHNYEGFMLTLGDVLVKAGRPDEAREVYDRARLAPSYEDWPYREVLEVRLLSADEVAAQWDAGGEEEPEMVFGSAYSCAACHRRGG